MAKKPNIDIPAIAVIRAIIFVFIAFVGFSAYIRIVDFFTTSPLFAVKDVLVDTSVRFIDPRELRGLRGRNIFKVNIRDVHARLAAQYPQISELRIIRQFPDKIKVLAKKRDLLAQVRWKNKFLLVDTQGAVLYDASSQQPSLPVINGIFIGPKVVFGTPLTSRPLRAVVYILDQLKSHKHTGALKIAAVQGGNPSKIEFILEGGLRILLDEDNFPLKVQKLDALLAQRIDWTKARYVDLRFNEPIIAAADEGKGK